MGFESFVALRYLRKRNLSRFLSFMTAVAIGSVAIGTAALIITFTILDGFERELRTNIIGFASHVQVGTFRNQSVVQDPDRLVKVRELPNVAEARVFLQKESIAITRRTIDGVLLKGINEREKFDHLRARISSGTFSLADSAGKPSVIIGKRLADRMGIRLHDKIVFLSVTNIRNVASAPKVQCAVRGIYETGMSEYFDGLVVFTSLTTARKLFDAAGQINGYDILCKDAALVDSTVNNLQTTLGYPFDPRSVFSIYRNLFIWIDLQQELIPVVVGSLIIISVFNIISTLLLFVMTKTQSIGILKAIGARSSDIRRIFVLQGLMIGCAGAAIGAGIAFVFSYAQHEWQFFSLPQDVYYMTTVPIHISLKVYIVTILIALTLSFLSSFIPAWLGSRLDPVRSIRFR